MRAIVLTILASFLLHPAAVVQDAPEGQAAEQPPLERAAAVPPIDDDAATTPETRMWREVGALLDELHRLRLQLAQVRLELDEVRRERDELRQFIQDNEELGQDFEQYRAVREIAEREQRQRELEAARERREVERAERLARVEQMRAIREQQREEAQRVRQYRDAGFVALGLDVYVSRVSYHYPTQDHTARLRFEPSIGWYHRYYRTDEIDFSRMTISGAVVNAAEVTRNIGVAIAFFDGNGVQVGQETIQINNARPDVPYPFTSEITMALDRPFSSSTSYVLYADPIDLESLPPSD